MALTDSQKTSALDKKSLGKSSTDTARDFFEEPYNGRPAVLLNQIWKQSDQIPTTAPVLAADAISGVVQYKEDLALTAVAGASNAFYSADLVDAIPFNFGDGSYNYEIKDSGGAAIAFGQNDWRLDPDTGTLYFYAGAPANMPPTVSFYKYVGEKGSVKTNNSATVDPTSTDDDSLGYEEGSVWINTTDDKAWICLDASTGAAIWQEVGAGSGGGGAINFIPTEDSDFEDGVGNWLAYNDATDYLDGDGGTSTLTVSVTSLASEILNGTQSLEIAKPASDVQFEGVSLSSIAIPRGYQNQVVQATFLADFSNATGEHWEVRAYDQTNSAILYTGPVESRAIPALKGSVTVPVYLENDCASVRLSLHCKSNSTDAYSVFVDDVKLSPITSVQVAKHTGVKTWIPTVQGFGAIGIDTAAYSINGNILEGQIKFTAGTVDSNQAQVGLPPGISVDTSAYSSGYNSANIVGVATVSGNKDIVTVLLDRTDTGVLKFGVAGGSFTGQNYFLGNQVLTSTQQLTINFTLHVADERQVLNEFELAQKTIKVSAQGNSSETIVANTTNIPFNTKVKDSLNNFTSNTTFTAPYDMRIQVSASVYFTAAIKPAFQAYINGVADRWIYQAVSSDTVHIFSAEIDLQAGDLFTFRSTVGGTLQTALPNLHWITISSRPDFTTYGVVKNYEVVESHSSTGAVWPFAANVWGDLTSITLTDGEWDLEFEINVGQNSPSAGPFNIDIGMGITSGNVAPTFLAGKGRAFLNLQNQQFESQTTFSANRSYFVSGGSQIIYLKAFSQNTSSARYGYYRITARRIK